MQDLEEEEECELKLVRNLSNTVSPAKDVLQRQTSTDVQAPKEFDLSKDQEFALKKQLTASTEEL